jgi:arylsulfatase A-like enzyme
MRVIPVIVSAVWTGAAFGIIEGIVLCVSRQFPVILAPYKTSAHVLWVAPLLDVVLFATAAVVGGLGLSAIGRWWRKDLSAVAFLTFVVLGSFAVLNSVRLIHPAAALVLALGVAVGPRSAWLRLARRVTTPRSTRWLAVVPIVLLSIWGGITIVDRVVEGRRTGALPRAAEEALNVLVLVLDTVRRDSFDARSTEASLTPNIDRLLPRGMWYDNAWATSSWSLPSHATLLTGLHPNDHGAAWPEFRLSQEFPTVPEVFTNHGYMTGAFSGNASWVTPEYLGRGFIEFKVYTFENHLRRTSYGRLLSRVLDLVGMHRAGRGRTGQDLNQDLLQFLDHKGDHPFFAYVCYMDVNQTFHRLRLNRPAWSDRPPNDEVFEAYQEGLRAIDEEIGALLRGLEARELLERTIIVLTSDHGESFGEALAPDHDPAGHGTSLYAEQTRVPLLVVDPRHQAGSETIKETVSLQSVPALLARMLGWPDTTFEDPKMTAPPGVALAVLRYAGRHQEAAAWSHWHFIEDLGDEPHERLFDLETDPSETHNLIGVLPVPADIKRLLHSTEIPARLEP